MYVIAISGASGPILGIRLIEELLKSDKEVAAVASDTAWQVICHELQYKNKTERSMKKLLQDRDAGLNLDRLCQYDNNDLFAPIASGSAKFDAVVVIPSSMKTLAAIAGGFADSLITRACDVALKEKRKCIIAPRETPLNLIHIENMTKAARAGAIIAPPAPGFYTHPETIDDVINFIVGKVLNLLDIDHGLFRRWGEGEERAK